MIHNHGLSPLFVFGFMFFFLLCPCTAVSQAASCDASIYGRPDKGDCMNLFEKITSPQNLQTRFFDEEQLRADSANTWPGVANVFQQPIVQLPKFYAMSMPISYSAIFRDSRYVVITFRRRYMQLRRHAIHESSNSCGHSTGN